MPPLACLLACLIGVASASAPASARAPNVVIFLADDQGWGDVSHNGNRNLSTPHLDSLARDGVRLTRFTVCAVCAPTRAEFLTGRYHPRTGVRGVSTGQERMDLRERTLADALRAAGYATGNFGKWHNGSQGPYHPTARGFAEYVGFTSGHWGEYFDPPLERNNEPFRARGYIADIFTDHALDFIDRHRERPFFCLLTFNTPHSPWAAPAEDWARFRDHPLPQRAEVPGEHLDHTRCALAMCENLDRNVGRVLERLRARNLERDTLVVYFSDNGPNSLRWNDGLKGRKGSLDEGGLRSVCLWRWPGQLPAGGVMPHRAGAIDLLPTLLALAGVERSGDLPLDGRDLSPWLRRPETAWPERLLFSHQAGKVAVRDGDWLLDPEGRLFDLQSDPGQRRDCTREFPARQRALAEAAAAWRREVLPGRPPGGQEVDARPLPVGYPGFTRTELPARDGRPEGQVKRSGRAPNCSYFVNWASPEDRLVWEIEVEKPGRFAVEAWYTCAEGNVGAEVELRFGEARLRGRVGPAWDPPLYDHQDTLPRPEVESKMKPFRPLALGEIDLPAGRGPLVLRATQIPGREVMDLRSLVLRRMPPAP
jgi:arylsulfatase A-like enzyme